MLFLLAIAAVSLTSCKKEKGCTDSESPSFNADAEKDDGSCKSVAEALVGSWTVSEQLNSDPGTLPTFDVTITKVDEETIIATTLNRSNLPYYAVDSLKLKADWSDKALDGVELTSLTQNLKGTITDVDEFGVTYEVVTFTGVNTVSLMYTR